MDTRSKRSSAVRMMRPWMLALPLPDGTVDAADREHTAFGYSGILSAVAVVPEFVRLTGLVLVGDNLVGVVSTGDNLVGEVL